MGQDEINELDTLLNFNAEGISGLSDEPRSGAPAQVTPAYIQRLLEIVRLWPRALEQPYSLWTLQRFADFLADKLGLRFSVVKVSRLLHTHGIVLSRPQHEVTSPDPEYMINVELTRLALCPVNIRPARLRPRLAPLALL